MNYLKRLVLAVQIRRTHIYFFLPGITSPKRAHIISVTKRAYFYNEIKPGFSQRIAFILHMHISTTMLSSSVPDKYCFSWKTVT